MLDIDEVAAKLFVRGYHAHGIAFVLRLMAAESPEGSERRTQLEAAADEFMN